MIINQKGKGANSILSKFNGWSDRSNRSRLRILAYHTVTDDEMFKKQMLFLSENFSVIDLQTLIDHLIHNKSLPENPLLITFDDGDRSVWEKAYPVLKKYDLPAVLFVITDLINSEKPFWWTEIEHYLGELEGNKKVWQVKEWPNREREKYLNGLRTNSGKAPLQKKQLTSSELKTLERNGIAIANHSHTHPMFNQCSKDEIKEEIGNSEKILNSLGFESRVFAYPNGNFSTDAEHILLQHGVKAAFLFDHKINREEIHPLRISRLVVNDSTPLWKLKFILSGWHSRILPLTRRLGKLLK